jgi:hypothetical protein
MLVVHATNSTFWNFTQLKWMSIVYKLQIYIIKSLHINN